MTKRLKKKKIQRKKNPKNSKKKNPKKFKEKNPKKKSLKKSAKTFRDFLLSFFERFFMGETFYGEIIFFCNFLKIEDMMGVET